MTKEPDRLAALPPCVNPENRCRTCDHFTDREGVGPGLRGTCAHPSRPVWTNLDGRATVSRSVPRCAWDDVEVMGSATCGLHSANGPRWRTVAVDGLPAKGAQVLFARGPTLRRVVEVDEGCGPPTWWEWSSGVGYHPCPTDLYIPLAELLALPGGAATKEG